MDKLYDIMMILIVVCVICMFITFFFMIWNYNPVQWKVLATLFLSIFVLFNATKIIEDEI